jgi:ABC-type antimicrobial peptide transport system permease subunit
MLFALAVGVTLHALVTGIRRRRHELAILRSLGFTSGNTRSSLFWQMAAMSAVAAGVGLPLGIVLGRLGWRAITHADGLVGEPVVPVWPAALAVVLAIVVPLLLAVVPTVREARRHVGAVLRVE